MDPSYIGDRVVPVIIGALIALLGAVVVQLVVVPNVEARKRREQRWEQDVLSLGELLTFELPKVLKAVTSELFGLAYLAEPPEGADPERLAKLRSEHGRQLQPAVSDLNHLTLRIDWLQERIKSLAPDDQQIMVLERRALDLRVLLMRLGDLGWEARYTSLVVQEASVRRISMDEVDKTRRTIDYAVDRLVSVIKDLAAGVPPRQALRRKDRQPSKAAIIRNLIDSRRRSAAARDSGATTSAPPFDS